MSMPGHGHAMMVIPAKDNLKERKGPKWAPVATRPYKRPGKAACPDRLPRRFPWETVWACRDRLPPVRPTLQYTGYRTGAISGVPEMALELG